jgi:hypothetical protein
MHTSTVMSPIDQLIPAVILVRQRLEELIHAT